MREPEVFCKLHGKMELFADDGSPVSPVLQAGEYDGTEFGLDDAVGFWGAASGDEFVLVSLFDFEMDDLTEWQWQDEWTDEDEEDDLTITVVIHAVAVVV